MFRPFVGHPQGVYISICIKRKIINLTYVEPYIVLCFYSKTNQMHNISNLFHFGTKLYIYRMVSPSTLRSFKTVHIYLMLYVQS